MSNNVHDLNVRQSVTETKLDNITNYLDEHKKQFDELKDTVYDMKNELTNLPHLVDAIKDLSKDLSTINNKLDSHESKLQANDIYTKIVWGIFMLLLTSGAGVLADWIINHNK